jgi:hypothetical protein
LVGVSLSDAFCGGVTEDSSLVFASLLLGGRGSVGFRDNKTVQGWVFGDVLAVPRHYFMQLDMG